MYGKGHSDNRKAGPIREEQLGQFGGRPEPTPIFLGLIAGGLSNPGGPAGLGSWPSQPGHGQFSKVQSEKMGPAPGRFELSKGILE